MKADTWKAVFAAMSPSPVFQALAELAELRVTRQRRVFLKQTDDTNGFSGVTREQRTARKVS
jgi:hypothetical protein